MFACPSKEAVEKASMSVTSSLKPGGSINSFAINIVKCTGSGCASDIEQKMKDTAVRVMMYTPE
jgi:hypothetical protein